MIRFFGQIALIIVSIAMTAFLALNAWDVTEVPIIANDAEPVSSQIPAKGKEPLPIVYPAIAAYPETVTRPIFFEGRQFPVIVVEAPKPPPPPPPPPQPGPSVSADQFRLLGIVQHGDQKRALIEGPSVLLDWYAEGSKLQDWTLSRIESNSIFLSFGIKTSELVLFHPTEQN